MTDNGACYKSHAFRDTCAAMGLRHIRTKSYTPKTKGKAERIIQTALREWAYGQTYQTSGHLTAELPRLAAPLQLVSATRRDKVLDTHQPTRPRRGQPIEAPQLGSPESWSVRIPVTTAGCRRGFGHRPFQWLQFRYATAAAEDGPSVEVGTRTSTHRKRPLLSEQRPLPDQQPK
jgi:hypothetical protein